MKSTDKDLFACERQAHLYYENAEQVNKDRIADRNTVTRFEESERKESVNMQFWRRVWVSCNVLLLLVVIYGLFQFFTR